VNIWQDTGIRPQPTPLAEIADIKFTVENTIRRDIVKNLGL
jgi:hypothetical protein